MNKEEPQVDKKVNKKEIKNEKPKEIQVNLNELLLRVKEEAKREAILEIRKDIVNLAYRIMSVELCTYKLVNRGNVLKEFEQDILTQEDLLSGTVETMLKRLKEISENAKKESEKLKKNELNKVDKGKK